MKFLQYSAITILVILGGILLYLPFAPKNQTLGIYRERGVRSSATSASASAGASSGQIGEMISSNLVSIGTSTATGLVVASSSANARGLFEVRADGYVNASNTINSFMGLSVASTSINRSGLFNVSENGDVFTSTSFSGGVKTGLITNTSSINITANTATGDGITVNIGATGILQLNTPSISVPDNDEMYFGDGLTTGSMIFGWEIAGTPDRGVIGYGTESRLIIHVSAEDLVVQEADTFADPTDCWFSTLAFNNNDYRRLCLSQSSGPTASSSIYAYQTPLQLKSNSSTFNFEVASGTVALAITSSTELQWNTNNTDFRKGRLLVDNSGNISASGTLKSSGTAGSNANDYVCVDTAGLFSSKATACTGSSARELKMDIQDLSVSTKDILALEPREYTRISNGKHEVGLIADEVALHIPGMVTYDENGKMYGVEYSQLPVHLLKVVKEQQNQIKELKDKVEKIEVAKGLKRDNRELYAIVAGFVILIGVSLIKKKV